MSDDNNNIIDFLAYKKTGQLKYTEYEPVREESEEIQSDEMLEQLAEVMSLSTDELFLEVGVILNGDQSPRNLNLSLLVTELSSRLVLMESICLLAANLDKNS